MRPRLARLARGLAFSRWEVAKPSQNGLLGTESHLSSLISTGTLVSSVAARMTVSSADGCSVVCVPVRTGGKMLGIIQLISVDMQIYIRNEVLLQTLADYAAIAIENARAVQRIQELSITDDCTGLYNARHLFPVLSEEIHRSQRFGYEFSLLFLDLDHFKRHQ